MNAQLDLKNNDPNEGSYLYPSDLLLGKASSSVPLEFWSSKECFKIRWKFAQVVDSFWSRWIIDYFPTLIIRPKWHSSTGNFNVCDVVMVQDSNHVRGQWKLEQVCAANPAKDGRVRDVPVRYKALEANLLTISVSQIWICSTCRKHFPVPSSFMTYHQFCN